MTTPGQQLFTLAALVWLLLLVRSRRPAWLLLGVLLANTGLVAASLLPLQRPYALGISPDRLHMLANSQVAAAGGSLLETFQVGQRTAAGRPHWVFWSGLVAAASGFDPDRGLAVYHVMSLVTALGFALSVYWCVGGLGGAPGRVGWEAALSALFATLLASRPLDFAAPYRDPWVMNFLLKPNHALGLVVFPLFLRAFAAARGWGARLGLALFLHAFAWLFLLHLVYLALGLAAFALVALVARPRGWRADLVDVGVVLGLNGLLGLFALRRFLSGYPLFEPSAEKLPLYSPQLLDVTFGGGWVFLLALWGAAVAVRRGSRLGRLLAAQLAAALALSAAYLLADRLSLVRSPDEIFYWIRFLSALLAGIGAFDVAQRAWRLLLPQRPAREALVAVLVCLAVLPSALPSWFEPARMDRYHAESLVPLPAWLDELGRYLRHAIPPDSVVATQPTFAAYVAALGARRVLLSNLNAPPDHALRQRLVSGLISGRLPEAEAQARGLGVTHVVLTRAWSEATGVTLAQLDRRPGWRRVFLSGRADADFAAVYRLEGAAR